MQTTESKTKYQTGKVEDADFALWHINVQGRALDNASPEELEEIRIEEAARKKEAVCEPHGYLEPDFRAGYAPGSIVVRPCPTCTAEREAREEREEEDAAKVKRAEKVNRDLSSLQIGKRFKGMTFADYKPTDHAAERILDACRRYVDSFPDRLGDGDGMIFTGKCGTGKNMLAACVCQDVIRQGHTAIHTTVFKLVRKVKGTWAKGSEQTEEQVIQSFTEPDILVIDEVGVQFGSDTEKLYLSEIINERYEQQRPTVLISNLTMEELEDFLGERVIDRFHEGKSLVLKFTWGSWRRKKDGAR